MQVIFIHHSCFLVEVDEKVLIFDWFAGNRIRGYTFHGVNASLWRLFLETE